MKASMQDIVTFVKSHPGCDCAQIAAMFKMTESGLRGRLRRLRDKGLLVAKNTIPYTYTVPVEPAPEPVEVVPEPVEVVPEPNPYSPLVEIIDNFTETLGKMLAAQVVASLRGALEREINLAMEGMQMPAAVKEIVVSKRPLIGVVGLSPVGAGNLVTTFKGQVDFRFVTADERGSRHYEKLKLCDDVYLMTGHVSHQQVEGLKAAGLKYSYANGGTSALEAIIKERFKC